MADAPLTAARRVGADGLSMSAKKMPSRAMPTRLFRRDVEARNAQALGGLAVRPTGVVVQIGIAGAK
jgi:hypothetical protein